MSQLNLHKTKKLHYGKYLYKLKLYNELASIFRTELQRNGKLSYAKTKLTEYAEVVKNNQVLYKNIWNTTKKIRKEHFFDANEIYKILKTSKEHLIRCETNTLIVYSNNSTMMRKLVDKTSASYPELWEPDPSQEKYLLENKNVIIVEKEPDFPYKVSFGRKQGKPELAKWLNSNTDKARAGIVLLENLKNSGWIQGQYIHVRDEKTILLIQMIVGDNISRIDKLVYKDDLDK
jgi:hypothetical protein